MTDSKPPRRFHSGGIVRGPMLKPGEIPTMLLRSGSIHYVPKRAVDLPPPGDVNVSFTIFDELPGAQEGRAIMDRLINDAILEATVRAGVQALIREFGSTLPLRALRALPKPLARIDAMVLAKLEVVAEHLGAP